MILDHQLAQQIVDRTMDIIGNNINVMNQAGVIIASGDKNRIGQLHDGALLALKHAGTVEVTTDDTSALKGVKPGINLLLKNKGQVIGVVGITGDPSEIRNYAELIKMTADMIVEQAELIEQLQWDRRHKEELVLSWVHNQLDLSRLESEAIHLNIDIASPRYAIIVKLIDSQNGISQQNIKQVMQILEQEDKHNLVAVLSLSELILLKKQPSSTQSLKNEKKLVSDLYRTLSMSGIDQVKLALGQTFPTTSDLHHSFDSGKQVLSFGNAHAPNDNIYLFEDFRLAMLLSPIKGLWQEQQLLKPYQKLMNNDPSEQLQKTLNSLFEHNGNMKQCAESLFIHRNTLRYRLDKIESITGISPHNFSGLAELFLAVQLNKLH